MNFPYRLILIAGTIFSLLRIEAQEPPAIYYDFIRVADSLSEAGKFAEAGKNYSAAFESFGWKGVYTDRIKAAESWARAGVTDSAFFNLERIAFKSTYWDLDELDTLRKLQSLHADPRWSALRERVRWNRFQTMPEFDEKLSRELDSLHREDQKWRSYSRRRSNGELVNDTLTAEQLQLLFDENDRRIAQRAKEIFRQYGYPGSDRVAAVGARTFWLLVQHVDDDVDFQDSVLVQLKTLSEKGLAEKPDYAYLVDRVQVNRGLPQVYGTQMQLNSDSTSYEPRPTIDMENLDARRASVGLPSEAEYVRIMNERFYGTLRKREE